MALFPMVTDGGTTPTVMGSTGNYPMTLIVNGTLVIGNNSSTISNNGYSLTRVPSSSNVSLTSPIACTVNVYDRNSSPGKRTVNVPANTATVIGNSGDYQGLLFYIE